MKFKDSQAARRMNASKEAFFEKRNAKRGHISHFQLFLKESWPKKILSLGVVSAATLTFAGVLNDGLDKGTESGRAGLSQLPEARKNVKNCVMNGIFDCIDSSTTSAPTGTETTVLGNVVTASVILCDGPVIRVDYSGPQDSPEAVVAASSPNLDPADLSLVFAEGGPFWEVNSKFDPATLVLGEHFYAKTDCYNENTFGG